MKIFNNQRKSESGRFGAEKLFLAGTAVFCLFFVVSCGLITNIFSKRAAVSTDNTNADNLNNASNSYDSEKYKAFLNQRDAIKKMSFPVKLDPHPMVKGKMAVVLDGDLNSSDYERGFLYDRKADNMEELETVIRIACAKGKFLGSNSYHKMGEPDLKSVVKTYGVDCQVALIDYPKRIITAQKAFSNNKVSEVIDSALGELVNKPPANEIENYLNDLPVDKVLPEMTRPDEHELIRVPFTVSLKSDAALKGKLFIAQKVEHGDLDSFISSEIRGYENFGFPAEKIANKTDELETLVKIVCVPGSLIGKFSGTSQFSNKCEVSIIDYKTLSVIAQKTIENKTQDSAPAANEASTKRWVVDVPKKEIEDYLKSLPTS